MANTANVPQEEWLKLLGKGMITIPKQWREALGLTTGDVIKAKRIGKTVVLEGKDAVAPYRIYSRREISDFLKDDHLSTQRTKVNSKFKLKRRI